MKVRIHAVAGAVPPHAYDQEAVLGLMRRWIGGDRRTDRVLSRVYRASGIRRRHSVLDEFLLAGDGRELGDDDGAVRDAGTAARNARYAREAPALARAAAERALQRVAPAAREAVTHLITVSCTGFHAPGVDDQLVRELGLRRAVERTHVGFMGCSAAFPALRLARSICRADPAAVVLLVAVELCTLHLRPSRDTSSVLATSVFADGAAAAVIGAGELHGEGTPLELVASSTYLCDAGATDMAWTIGDHGFEMLLSAEVPNVLAAELGTALAPLVGDVPGGPAAIGHWAVHPGGRAILDRVAAELALPEQALAASRAVLAEAGNMSSATVLFVLERMMAGCREHGTHAVAPGDLVAALAFGPGLTVDGALLRAG